MYKERDNVLKMLNSISLYIRRAWDHTMPLEWKIPERVIYDHEILYIKEGEIFFDCKSGRLEGKPGDIFFIPPFMAHSIMAKGSRPVRQPHIHFDFFYSEDSETLDIPLAMPKKTIGSRENITHPLLQLPVKISLKDPVMIENLMMEIISEQESQKPLSILKKKALLFEILYILLNRNYFELEKEKEKVFEKVKLTNEYIRKNVGRNLTTEEIADEMGYSKNYFVSVYKEIYGMSPIKYHENIRISKAKQLLHITGMSITAISMEMGFDSVYSFSRYFKRLTKTSPQQCRQRLI